MLFSRHARAEEFSGHTHDKEIIRPMMIDEMLGFNTTCVSPNADGLLVDHWTYCDAITTEEIERLTKHN